MPVSMVINCRKKQPRLPKPRMIMPAMIVDWRKPYTIVARKASEQWSAACMELNVSASGPTKKKAISELVKRMRSRLSYHAGVLEDPKDLERIARII